MWGWSTTDSSVSIRLSNGQSGENIVWVVSLPVAKGIRLATITLAKHIPPHVIVPGHRMLVSYDGQIDDVLWL
jgi:hypothetical protein